MQELKDRDNCIIIKGPHNGKTGHITITVEQTNGIKFTTLGKNILRLSWKC